jgi:lysyl-tRNA synthetase, class I
MTNEKSSYWLDIAADDISKKYPNGRIILSSGHSPSGTYHIGLLREMMIVNALTWALKQRGRDAIHIDFVDDFDILRKIPSDLPENLKSELGKPLYLAVSPKKNLSYGEYSYQNLVRAAERIGFTPDETYFARVTYGEEHRYTEAIEKALAKLPQAKDIIESVSHRKLSADWGPVQILSNNNLLNEWTYIGHDLDRQVVKYRTQSGGEGEVTYTTGRVKLDWRLDWPARWWMWSVNVEPFGRDHASKGGSYDTGKELVRKIFGGEAPIPIPYGFINPVGQSKKFSKSAGGVLTPNDAADIMPAEILRFYAVRSRPEKEIVFDPGMALANLIDEFAAAQANPEHEFSDAYKFAVAGSSEKVIASVPFKHLVQVYQAGQGDYKRILELLDRTGWKPADSAEEAVLKKELGFVKNWLDKYAPNEVKFEVQEQLPRVELTDNQKTFLGTLASCIDLEKPGGDGQKMHELIYASVQESGIAPAEAFRAIYRVVLGQDSGPKAGWFLASLDPSWLAKRLCLEA